MTLGWREASDMGPLCGPISVGLQDGQVSMDIRERCVLSVELTQIQRLDSLASFCSAQSGLRFCADAVLLLVEWRSWGPAVS